jgi:peptidoglycan/xylan/chitin deacetylase (PgdA/CDA1 family)
VEEIDPNKIAYITLDDGPDWAGYTDATLDVLQEPGYQIGATYFLHGANIAGNETTVQRIRNEGHGIGNHSQDHKEWYDAFNARDFPAMTASIN